MAYAMLEIEFAFQDDTTKKMTFGPFATTSYAITGAKANIKAFNYKYRSGATPPPDPDAAWVDKFVNENGSALKVYSTSGYPIANAAIIVRTETDINLYD